MQEEKLFLYQILGFQHLNNTYHIMNKLKKKEKKNVNKFVKIIYILRTGCE